MQLRNSTDTYGFVAILCHWLAGIGFLSLFGLGWYMVGLGYYDPLYNTLPALHKSFGLLLMLLVVLQLVWKVLDTKPKSPSGLKAWEAYSAGIMHWLLLLGSLVIMASGYLIPTADGMGVSFFNLFEVPAIVSGLSQQEDRSGLVHEYLSYFVLGLAMLHIAAALKHFIFNRDNILHRILGIKKG